MKGVPRGHVRLACDDPPLPPMFVLLGPEPWRMTAGAGGWDVTARPRQVGMTTWNGVEPFQVELSLMFDGYAAGRSQEPALRRLLVVARGDESTPPGILTIDGLPLPADEWVIEGLSFGDAILRRDGSRVRQLVTLTLREHVDPSYLQLRRGALQGTKGKTRVITAHKDDTAARIARRQHCKWTDLRALNPTVVKKANAVIKTGTKLRAPVATAKKKHPTKATKGRSRS
jgi:hypothetical protein